MKSIQEFYNTLTQGNRLEVEQDPDIEDSRNFVTINDINEFELMEASTFVLKLQGMVNSSNENSQSSTLLIHYVDEGGRNDFDRWKKHKYAQQGYESEEEKSSKKSKGSRKKKSERKIEHKFIVKDIYTDKAKFFITEDDRKEIVNSCKSKFDLQDIIPTPQGVLVIVMIHEDSDLKKIESEWNKFYKNLDSKCSKLAICAKDNTSNISLTYHDIMKAIQKVVKSSKQDEKCLIEYDNGNLPDEELTPETTLNVFHQNKNVRRKVKKKLEERIRVIKDNIRRQNQCETENESSVIRLEFKNLLIPFILSELKRKLNIPIMCTPINEKVEWCYFTQNEDDGLTYIGDNDDEEVFLDKLEKYYHKVKSEIDDFSNLETNSKS